tara:strand:- start:103544 stop:103990 length:447 start_codon:yes stop_codon:yes gene_type:complete
MMREDGYIEQRRKAIYLHEEYKMFFITGQTSYGDQPIAEIGQNSEGLSIPNYELKPQFKISCSSYDRRSYILPIPFDALSADQITACKSIAEPFNEHSSIDLSVNKAREILRIWDSCTGCESEIPLKQISAVARYKICPDLAPKQAIY